LNIFVCVKQVPDIRSDIEPNSGADYIDKEHLHWIINPEDECAVEEALQIREQFPDTTITALRVGSEQDSEALINAMAMGADESILVLADEEDLDPYMAAKALKGAIEHSGKNPDLVLCGNESFGDESRQVPQILAQMLDFPCVTRVINVSISDTELNLDRQIEGGTIESYRSCFPIVISCSYALNEPRYAPLPYIKKAHKKPMLKLALHDTGISDQDQRLRFSNFRTAPKKKTGKVFNASKINDIDNVVAELIETVRTDIKSLEID
jgi:electron transfer flavoprotein beta subunit